MSGGGVSGAGAGLGPQNDVLITWKTDVMEKAGLPTLRIRRYICGLFDLEKIRYRISFRVANEKLVEEINCAQNVKNRRSPNGFKNTRKFFHRFPN